MTMSKSNGPCHGEARNVSEAQSIANRSIVTGNGLNILSVWPSSTTKSTGGPMTAHKNVPASNAKDCC